MAVAWRIAKARHAVYDGTGAMLRGGRWNWPGRLVIYASDTFAGAVLEILAHALRPRTLPGPHHAVRINIPDDLIEVLDPAELPGWDAKDSPEALRFGDGWLEQARSAVLIVPAVASRPIGRNVLINPLHPDSERIVTSEAFPVPWVERLF
ncbi:MAG: RES domain-containing protein [Gemmatimonadetes bacterium]|nr:RES domain-containing protein [Gemmatimonadota bacterium]